MKNYKNGGCLNNKQDKKYFNFNKNIIFSKILLIIRLTKIQNHILETKYVLGCQAK